MDESIIQSILNAAIEIDYESLKYLRDTSNLVPGTYYRIIDFVTKTAQPNTRSAEHQFDIIVQAVYSNVLSENAYAVKHAGLSTDYFANSDLSSWKIGYALDNVSSAYGWGDNIGGKGVIYYMKDEFNNECPYDFKNIQFLRQKNTHNIWCYTFSYYYDGPNSTLEVVDTSIKGNDGTLTGENRDNTRNVQNNVIKEFRDYVAGVPTAPAFLNSIVFLSTESYGINYGGCSNNVFGRDCYVNTFGNACNDNKFGERCYLNTFENDCSSNTTENFFIQNGFGNGCCRNTFGNECTQIKFYEGCTDNSFESSCSSITLAENCTDNSFESSCDNIIFEAAYTKNVTVETNNRNITLKALDTSAVTVNYHLEDIIFKENYNNSDTAKTVAANNYYENNTPPENTKIYAPDKIIDVDPNLLLNSPKLSNPNIVRINDNGAVYINGIGSYNGTNEAQAQTLQQVISGITEPMIFKGSVGTDGTVEWADLPSAAAGNKGWMYVVITAHDTTPVCEVGDTIISDGTEWVVIPSGDEPSGTVTSVAATGDTVISISGSPITTSGTLSITHGDSGATAGSYGDSSAQTPGYGDTFKVPYVTVDVKGHVTGISEHTVTIPASDNTDRYVNSAAFADNTASDANNPVKMTLTRAGSDSATVTANIPKVSSSGAGVVPKGASVSTQSQTTKFLREDGTWAAPSYTTDTNTTYTLGTDGNDVTLTPSSGSQQSITVPYATNAGTASAIGSSTVGSQSVPVYISSGTPTTISYIDTSYLKEPDYDKSTLTSLPLVNTTSGNHFALLPADQIIIEQTTDGGTTWTDAGITDDNKSKLFLGDTSYITSISIPLLDGVRNKQCGLRITFTAMKYDVPEGTPETDKYNYWNSTYATSIERYVTVQSMYIWALAVNDAIRTRVYAAKGSTPTTWEAIDRGNNIYLTGWPNGTFLSLSEDQTFGTSALSTSSRYWNYRIEMFTDGVDGGNLATSSNSTKQAIARISGYGKNVYTSPSYLVYMNHLYTWDKLQTMILPSSIRPRTNNAADMGTTSYRWSGIYGVNGNLSGTLSVTGTSTLTGNVTASGNLSVGGNITDSGDLTVNGNTTLGNATTDTVTISGPATIGTTLRVSGNDEYIGTGTGAQCHIQYDNTNKCVKFIFD